MIADDKFRGMKSVKCACGSRSALLERPNSYQAKIAGIQNHPDRKDIYNLIDVRYVNQKRQMKANQTESESTDSSRKTILSTRKTDVKNDVKPKPPGQ